LIEVAEQSIHLAEIGTKSKWITLSVKVGRWNAIADRHRRKCVGKPRFGGVFHCEKAFVCST